MIELILGWKLDLVSFFVVFFLSLAVVAYKTFTVSPLEKIDNKLAVIIQLINKNGKINN